MAFLVWASAFLDFVVEGRPDRLGFGISVLGFAISGLGFGISGLGFGISGLGFSISGLGFAISGLPFGTWLGWAGLGVVGGWMG